MPTVTIDLTKQEHDRLTARAAHEGRSVSEFVKNGVLPDEMQHAMDLEEIGILLEERLHRTRCGGGGEIVKGSLYDHLEARAEDRGR